MTGQISTSVYYQHSIPIQVKLWRSLGLGAFSHTIAERRLPPITFFRQLAFSLNKLHTPDAPTVYAAHINLFSVLQSVLRYLIDVLAEEETPNVLLQALQRAGFEPEAGETGRALLRFVETFPPAEVLAGELSAAAWLAADDAAGKRKHMVLREMILLHHSAMNPAVESFREILDDRELAGKSRYKAITAGICSALADTPFLPVLGCSLGDALWAPIHEAPDSLAAQIRLLYDKWRAVLPPELSDELTTAFDFLREEERERGWGGDPGPPPVLEFGFAGKHAGGFGAGRGDSVFAGFDYPEYEHFSPDADWMSNVVLMAKMVYVWLDQLSRSHGFPITRLDQIPDAELDLLAGRGFTGLWLIGLWERSTASQRIKQLCGNPEAIASAYSLYDYEIAADLGGWEALGNLRERAGKRGIRLASDMVPNHTGIYSRWIVQHPDWFVQTDYPPFPTYQFNGEDLSHDGNVCLQIEDGYWSKHDAAVVFRHYDRRDGRTRYIYHGNDGTSIPWNDTAQLNYLIPDVREAVIQTILHVARNFQIIRFDAAMTLAKKHYQRLWYPLRGLGGGIPSRAGYGMGKEEFDAVFPTEFWREVVDRVAAEAPGTLLLAEAFWMMEGYFVRTLGMHRVYNSAFMNMLKMEENEKYRHTIRNVLEFNPEILKRFVNFMNNPDEKTAVAQFGSQDKYFGACVLLSTMPGLPMFGHGQIEGFHEKYGMEYKRAYWDEEVDEGLVRGHELWIFPLLRKRWLFSGSEHFILFDFHAGDTVDENVFAYSNRSGEHAALVLYHNKYARTSGRIRESVGFNVKRGDAEPEIHRTTLGAALGCSADDGAYLVFRDHVRNLEYLRSSREVSNDGLFVELHEYQFHVFVDFREIRDTAEGSWHELCRFLGGRGVESLEDERKQLRYRALNDAFENVIREAVQHTPDSGPVQLAAAAGDDVAFIAAAEKFFDELLRLSDDRKKLPGRDSLVSSFGHRIRLVERLLKMKPLSKDARSLHGRLAVHLESVHNLRLLAACLLLRGFNSGAFEHFGLDCRFRRLFDANAPHATAILSVLLKLADKSPAPASAFSSPASREFLLVHHSDGVEWFNKERFEELVWWRSVLALLEDGNLPRPASALATAAANIEKEFQYSISLAAHAGYRTGLFQQLTAVSPAKPATGAKAPRKRTTTQRKADDKRPARAHTPEASDDTLSGS